MDRTEHIIYRFFCCQNLLFSSEREYNFFNYYVNIWGGYFNNVYNNFDNVIIKGSFKYFRALFWKDKLFQHCIQLVYTKTK